MKDDDDAKDLFGYGMLDCIKSTLVSKDDMDDDVCLGIRRSHWPTVVRLN